MLCFCWNRCFHLFLLPPCCVLCFCLESVPHFLFPSCFVFAGTVHDFATTVYDERRRTIQCCNRRRGRPARTTSECEDDRRRGRPARTAGDYEDGLQRTAGEDGRRRGPPAKMTGDEDDRRRGQPARMATGEHAQPARYKEATRCRESFIRVRLKKGIDRTV